MKFFNLFNKQKIQGEVKNYQYGSVFLDSGSAGSLKDNPSTFQTYYNLVHPFRLAIEMITQASQSIPIKLYDSKKDEYITNHPFLSLINRPNPYQSGSELIGSIVRSYLITGNVYLTLRGLDTNREPNSIYPINASVVNIEDNSTGFPYLYTVCYNQIQTYKNDKDKGRYFYQDNELIHFRAYNSSPHSEFLYGESPANAIHEELSIYSQINQNNRNILSNGMRLSGVLNYEGSLTDDEMQQAQRVVKSKYQGEKSAGEILLSAGESKVSFTPLSLNPKDMDFKMLQERCEKAIFQAYKIPLDFVFGESTYNNQDNARYSFYDNCVLFYMEQIFNFLTQNILRTRFKNSENLELKIDTWEIEVMQNKVITQAVDLYQAGINTLNETRTTVGKEGDVQGGDDFYQPSNSIVIGSDSNTQDNRKKPVEKSISQAMVNTIKSSVEKGTYTKDEALSIIQALPNTDE